MRGEKEEKQVHRETSHRVSARLRVGVIAAAFLIMGYEVAVFVHQAARQLVAASRAAPDTVWVSQSDTSVVLKRSRGKGQSEADRFIYDSSWSSVKSSGSHSSGRGGRKVETFRFNPNTVSVENLVRLGFSQKQAESIDAYRRKGGHFRRSSDFQSSYVVSDSVYRRLEPFIDIPLVDINTADSAAFDALPGIGPYFASKMVSYREELGGYSCKEQLMEIYHFDQQKFDALKDLITVSNASAFPLWTADAATLRRHPAVHDYATAKAIVLYRENNPPEKLTVQGLLDAGVISADQAARLSRCRIVSPN